MRIKTNRCMELISVALKTGKACSLLITFDVLVYYGHLQVMHVHHCIKHLAPEVHGLIRRQKRTLGPKVVIQRLICNKYINWILQ